MWILRYLFWCLDSPFYRDQFARGLPRLEYDASNIADTIKLTLINVPKVPVIEWWAEDLAILHFNFFQRTISAMRSKGLMCESIGGAIMHFAHRALKKIHNRQNGQNLLSIECNPEVECCWPKHCLSQFLLLDRDPNVRWFFSFLPFPEREYYCSGRFLAHLTMI